MPFESGQDLETVYLHRLTEFGFEGDEADSINSDANALCDWQCVGGNDHFGK